MKWTPAKFRELFGVKHGYAFNSKYFDISGEFVLLTPGSFHESGGYRERGEKTKYYTGDIPDGYVLDEGELLVAMTEQAPGLLGSSAWIPESNRFLHNQRLGRIVNLNARRIDKRFLYYLFNTAGVRGQIAGSASGTKVRHTAPERIGRVEVRIPPIEAQRWIAATLTAYDDAIENNRRRMGLLERAARLLYEEWFVRLRFPGHEHTRIHNGVPEGWERMPLNEICPDLREAANPADMEPDTPYIGLEHIPRRFITLHDWGIAEDVTSTKLKYQAGDIIFGKIRPYFHKVGFALTDGVTSSDAIVLRPVDSRHYSFSLLTVSSDWFVTIVSKTAKEGSKMPRADWKLMERHLLAVPPHSLLDSLNETVQPMLDQLRNLAFQNQKLRAARDLLLPRLMSGEIEV
jgi:type I restriction enzyme S subunit